MTIEELRSKREDIEKLAESYGAEDVRVFGSIARGESAGRSDVDFIVRMRDGTSFLDLVGLWQDLEALLGCSVDVITDGGVSPHLKDQIAQEAKAL